MPERMDLRTHASVELNILNATDAIGRELEGMKLGRGTPIYDINGEELFERIPLQDSSGRQGYTDIASNPAMGGVLIAVSYGVDWNEELLLQQAREAAGKRLADRDADTVRFVAYSFPKIAVQFLAEGKELALLELWTWQPVPTRRRKREESLPSNFERWSFLDEQPAAELAKRRSRFRSRVKSLEPLTRIVAPIDVLRRDRFLEVANFSIVDILFDRRDLHFSSRNTDHATCYEVRGQQTNVWCVGASTQMLLDFYRYEYTQIRLAQELGLGTLSNPNGLPYSRVNDVVTVIEKLTSKALDATMNTSPNWTQFRNEIRANRPMISFIPGHSRTIAGYTRTNIVLLNLTPFRGLLVYDPWPPNAGVITRWENFDTQTYTHAYTALVTLV